jgi:hypothetical protein
MHQKYRLTTQILDKALPEGAAGIVLPVPPSTATQKFHTLLLSHRWQWQEWQAINVPQKAVFVESAHGILEEPFVADISIPCCEVDEAHFLPYAIPSLEPGSDAREWYESEQIGVVQSDAERLAKILNCIAAKFNYQHGVNSGLPLTCNVLTGNCLDINAAFIKLLRLAEIRNCYYIGYFFEQGKPLTNDDWHCWVDTISSRGYENWDIAHYLKRCQSDILPALNPIEGIRFAMGTGRDLRFDGGFAQVAAPHLCEPRWVFPDGSTRQCRIAVSAAPI